MIDRNWKTRRCEIDIVATRNNKFYFIEVKFRSSYKQGGGLEAITSKKLRQMNFAAEMYLYAKRLNKHSLLAVMNVESAQRVTFLELT